MGALPQVVARDGETRVDLAKRALAPARLDRRGGGARAARQGHLLQIELLLLLSRLRLPADLALSALIHLAGIKLRLVFTLALSARDSNWSAHLSAFCLFAFFAFLPLLDGVALILRASLLYRLSPVISLRCCWLCHPQWLAHAKLRFRFH